jgi:uncharacterized membrane protein YphA (DoxX/SURF4 family)
MNSFKIRETKDSKLIGSARIMLGIIFLMTGVMKLAFSRFGAAWSIQLVEAEIPLYGFVVWFIPVIEIGIGIVLLSGYFTRIGALIVLPIMLVGIYVHLTVSNPGAFPAQPQLPIVPVMVLAMALPVLIRGGGSWSRDLRFSQSRMGY